MAGMVAVTETPERQQTRRSVRRRGSARKRIEARWAWILIAPSLIGLGVFSIWPIFRTLYYSFTLWGPFGGHTWNGLSNYKTLFSDSEVLRSLRNTIVFAALSLLSVPIGIVVSALLNRQGLKGLSIYRTIYFIPVITLPAAVALMWRFVYNGDYGPINQVLGAVGINGPHWTSDPSTALYSVAVVAIWSSIGYNMVLFLAGMQTIPRQFYEAAEIDGAGRIRQFFQITLPLLSPTIFFVTVISVINALQAFDLIYVMIGKNNPALADSETIVYLFYEKGFIQSNGGYAAAIAFLLLGIIIVFTAGQFWLQRRWVHYD
jgi:multiple sugar transport system permease protein